MLSFLKIREDCINKDSTKNKTFQLKLFHDFLLKIGKVNPCHVHKGMYILDLTRLVTNLNFYTARRDCKKFNNLV